jgi:hypothetical protein
MLAGQSQTLSMMPPVALNSIDPIGDAISACRSDSIVRNDRPGC